MGIPQIPLVPIEHQSKAQAGIGIGIFSSVFYGINPDLFTHYLSTTMSHQFTQMTLTFTLAAWVHQAGVRKEMARNMEKLGDQITFAVNGVKDALTLDLAKQEKRSDNIEARVSTLALRVEELEIKKIGV